MNMLYLMVVVLFSPLPFLSPFSSAEAISNDVAYGPNFDHIHILNPQSYPIVGDKNGNGENSTTTIKYNMFMIINSKYSS